MVVALFSAIFAAMMSLLTNSDTYWTRGQNKVREQQEARRVMDTMVKALRDANPSWLINGTYYNLSITSNYTNLTFYRPVFNETTNNISTLQKVTFRRSTFTPTNLRQKIGSGSSTNLTTELSAVRFTGSQTGADPFNCTAACNTVRIELTTRKDNDFLLVGQVSLRNRPTTLDSNVTVESSEEGAF